MKRKFQFSLLKCFWGLIIIYSCSNKDEIIDPVAPVFDLILRSDFSNESNANVMTNGIYAIWWDKNFEHDHTAEADFTFSKLNAARDRALNELHMFDPPNVAAGFYVNIYIHHDGDIFNEYNWGNGVGTNAYGLPYWSTGHGGTTVESNIYHESFHLFQYNQNSPGFTYSGDSMWYTETTAQWFAFTNQPFLHDAIVEAKALIYNPQLALWHSFDNAAPEDPITWLYEVRQYAMHGYLFYLTEIEGVASEHITNGFSAGVSQTPQEYLFQVIGAENLRTYFANWAAANTSNLSYLTSEQVERADQEVEYLIQAGITSDEYKNEFILDVNAENLNVTLSPPENLKPRGWSYNVIKLSNTSSNSFSLTFESEPTGSDGATAFFEVRIVTKDASANYNTFDVALINGQSGQQNVVLEDSVVECYLVVVSVPDFFTGNQTYNYTFTLSEN